MSRHAWWRLLGARQRAESTVAASDRVVDLPLQGLVRVGHFIDCRGAMCPRPQMLTMKVMQEMKEGDVVEVNCDNPAAVEGFPSLAIKLASTHLCTQRDGSTWHIYLRKGA